MRAPAVGGEGHALSAPEMPPTHGKPGRAQVAKVLSEGSPCDPRGTFGTTDARALVRERLAMNQLELDAVVRGSPMKRAKRRGLARNAAVALGNVGTAEDIPVPEAALDHDEPLVREHAAWALARLGAGRTDTF